jgi:hypothetical protein
MATSKVTSSILMFNRYDLELCLGLRWRIAEPASSIIYVWPGGINGLLGKREHALVLGE